MKLKPLHWALDSAYVAYYYGDNKRAKYLIHKICEYAVKETKDGEGK